MLSKLTHTGRARVIMRLAAIAFPFLPLTYDHTNGAETKTANPRPNVIIILANDIGYGDPQYFNPESKINREETYQVCKGQILLEL